jgi:hypothetical protein
MKPPKYCVKTKGPFYQKIKLLKSQLLTFLAFRQDWKKSHLQKITDKAKIIAKSMGLHYSFEVFIDPRKSRNYGAIGAIHKAECEQFKTIRIGIYSNLVMASEEDILFTIFHEYCHFLLFHPSDDTDWTFAGLLAKDKIPKIFGDHREWVEENFCESFSYYINGVSVVDSEVEDIFNFLNDSTYQKYGTAYKLL